MKHLAISLFCLLSFVQQGMAHDLLGKKPDNRDTSYISTEALPWNIRVYGVTKLMEFNLQPQSDSIPSARYTPQEKIGIGMGAFYKSFGVYLGFHTFGKKADQIRLDLQLNQFGKKFTNDLYLQIYRGLYLENGDVFQRYLNSIPGSYRSDVTAASLGINSYYYFNWKKFSMRAAFVQSEYQKKNAGTWMLGGSYSGFAFQADNSLIPLNDTAAERLGVKAGNATILALNGGYSYMLVWKKYAYASLAFIGGGGFANWNYENEINQIYSDLRPVYRIAARASVGYNAERYFFGLNAIFDRFTILDDVNNATYSLGNLRFFVGFRPKFH